MPALTAAEHRQLLLLLSDRESGSARQWLLLELAAVLPAQMASRRIRFMGLLPTALMTALSLPVVRQLYARRNADLTFALVRGCDDAFLLLVATTAFLAGFQRLPASQQFLAWLLLIGGLLFKTWRRMREPVPLIAEPDGEESLPGAEAALGMRSLLLARGLPDSQVTGLLERWRSAPESVLPQLLATLPELSVPPALKRDLILLELAGWAMVLWPATWILGWHWGWLAVLVLSGGLSWLIHQRLRQPGLIALTGLLMFALAKLLHWI
jgi:hypothetical protein